MLLPFGGVWLGVKILFFVFVIASRGARLGRRFSQCVVASKVWGCVVVCLGVCGCVLKLSFWFLLLRSGVGFCSCVAGGWGCVVGC